MIGGAFGLYFLLRKELRYELKRQDALRKAELEPIKEQVYNHLPTMIKELGDRMEDRSDRMEARVDKIETKLDTLIIHLIPKPKDTDADKDTDKEADKDE